MKNSNSFFSNVVVETPELQLLPAGKNIVRLFRHEELDSFTQYSGEPKAQEKDYDIPTPQLAITVVSAEDGKSGGLTHRFNGLGYVKADELTEEQKKDERYSEVDGFACCMHAYDEKSGQYVVDLEKGDVLGRIVDTKRTQSCKNIMMQFARSAGLVEEQGFLNELDRIEADPDATFEVTVSVEEYNGKDQYRLTNFKPVSADIEAESLLED